MLHSSITWYIAVLCCHDDAWYITAPCCHSLKLTGDSVKICLPLLVGDNDQYKKVRGTILENVLHFILGCGASVRVESSRAIVHARKNQTKPQCDVF